MAREALRALASESRSLSDLFAQEASDRAAAIVEATQLDARLKSAILTKMVPLTKGEEGALFKGDAPLASFSARIRMAYALGIISKDMRSDLDAIRDIRNVFAHAQKHITFETDAVRSACLSLNARMSDIVDMRPPDTARDHYEQACITLLLKLGQRELEFDRPEESDPLNI